VEEINFRRSLGSVSDLLSHLAYRMIVSAHYTLPLLLPSTHPSNLINPSQGLLQIRASEHPNRMQCSISRHICRSSHNWRGISETYNGVCDTPLNEITSFSVNTKAVCGPKHNGGGICTWAMVPRSVWSRAKG